MRFSVAFSALAFASCTLAAPVAQGFGGNEVNANKAAPIISGGPEISRGQIAPSVAFTGDSGAGGGALGNAAEATASSISGILGVSGLSGGAGGGIAAGPAGKAAAKPGAPLASGAIDSQVDGNSQSAAPPSASALAAGSITPPANSPFASASAGGPPPVQSVQL